MINSLTEEQISKFPEYVDKWTKIGLSTKRNKLEDAIIDFSLFQKHILLKKEIAPVVILDSPLKCWIAILLVKNLFNKNNKQVESQVRSQVRSQVESQVWSQVESQVGSRVWSRVWSQVGPQVESQVRSQVESQVRSQVGPQVESQVESRVWPQVGSQVRSQVRSQVGSRVWSQVESQVRSRVWSQVRSQVGSQNIIYPYFDCQFWSSYISFYDFIENELKIAFTNKKEYDIFKKCINYGMVFPLDELCIVCQCPTQINLNKNGLHKENGPALSYNGDNEIYALNGVVMDKKYILTPSYQINSRDIIKEKNVEIRRELFRKVEIDRVMDYLPHKLLDKRGNYELYSIDLSDEIKNAKYLKMLNPSIKTYHLEGVDPKINTIAEALLWRNQNLFQNAEILT